MNESELSKFGPEYLIGKGAWVMELGTVIIFIAVLVMFAIQTRRRGSLSDSALFCIGALSFFWQEFYADWATYLAWSPAFHMMPWGPTHWTTPHKPWFVVLNYPLFYGFAFTLMLALSRAAIRKFPSANLLLICFLTAGPLLALINFALEVGAVANLGMWSYVDTIGPTWSTAVGQQPILYPNAPLGIFGAILTYFILRRGRDGHPQFEQLTHPERFAPGWSREGMRALSWIIVCNLAYWFAFSFPLIIVRELFGQPNSLVP